MSLFEILCLLSTVLQLNANINLLIRKDEMNRTLGVKAELNYIENGQINSYSTKFHYRINEAIDYVSFTWNAIGKVEYDVKVEADDSSVISIIRLPPRGIVPQKLEDFSVEYRCAGHKSGQFSVNLYFNFYYDEQTVSIKLRQEKICSSKDGRRGLNGNLEDLEEEESVDRVFFFIVCLAIIFLVVIALALVCYFKKSKKEERHSTKLSHSSKSVQQFLLSTAAQERNAVSFASSTNAPSSTISATVESIIVDSCRSVDVRKALISLYQDRELFIPLQFNELEGTFGETRFAMWRLSDDPINGDVDDEEDAFCQQIAVYTKYLKNNASAAQLDRFLTDCLHFHNIPPHLNLAQVSCVATYGRFDRPETVTDFPLVCYRHQGFGNLKKFLLNCKSGDKFKGAQTLRTQQLVHLGVQIGQALAHLHKHKVIHNDVATRNCLIAESNNRLHVQLCDSALSKDIFSSDYHCLGDNDNRPLKWMSPEAISTGVYTSASDVWSFGVTLWELMTLGANPFNDDDAEDIYSMLTKGLRLPPPQNCPDQLYKIMIYCWSPQPEARPTAAQVVQGLQDFTVHLNNYF